MDKLETAPAPGPAVAGMVASAGGLDAFKRFFAAMPAQSGVAFVLVPHLDPQHESLMVELIARHTAMPVVEVTEAMPVEVNHVYIIPPNKYMTISDGVLRLTGPVRRGDWQTSIDPFLRSLADDKQEKAICVILSGTGTHGTLGLRAVKAAGGMAVVQDPTTAEYARMPESAIQTGLADYVLSPEQMPNAIIKYVEHYYVNGGTRVPEPAAVPDHLHQLLALLRARTRFDFRHYRTKMLTRRVERRMGLTHFERLPDYLAHLREHPDEIKRLSRDLLLSVTSFFRDPEAFRALETEAIAALVAAKDSDATLRVWVPGCATGEEAYSIAILCLERLGTSQKSCRLQIFATDVDGEALEVARLGVYPESIAADVSPERLGRFFTRADDSAYQINKQVRETVIFAAQNLITDAPFSRLDLISCRNVLIYLEPEVQKKIINLVHFALSPGGFLFLGPSESIGRQTDLFDPITKKWRIYRKIGATRPDRVEIPIAPRPESPARDLRQSRDVPTRDVNFADVTQRLLLERLAPTAVLVNRKSEILYLVGQTARYLDLPSGEPALDLIAMAREGLRAKLRGAIHKAIQDGHGVDLTNVQMRRNGGQQRVAVSVTPVQTPKAAEGLLLVTFRDMSAVEAADSAPELLTEDALVRQLETELRSTKEDLQSTIEEMESSNEELKSSNEEVMSMNEELQSANEELETSKEELQSLNEELSTVNNQLQDKIDALEATNNDIANLLDCTEIATVFLGSQLRIRRFTPAATQLFSLIPTDVGRPLGDIATKFSDAELLPDAELVLRQFTPRAKEVQTTDGRWWSRSIVPYRTMDGRVDGVAIAFWDNTQRKHYEQALHRSEQRLAAELAAMTRLHELVARLLVCPSRSTAMDEVLVAAIEITGAEMGIVHVVNPQIDALEIVAQRGFKSEFLDRFRTVSGEGDSACGRAMKAGQRVVIEDVLTDPAYRPLRAIAASAGYRSVQSTPLKGRDGNVLGILSTHYSQPHRPSDRDLRVLDLYARQAADFIERQRASEAIHHLNKELEQRVAERTQDVRRLAAIVDASHDAIYGAALDGTMTTWNAGAERLYGYTAEEAIGQSCFMIVPPDHRVELEDQHKRLLRGEIIRPFETRRTRKDGRVLDVSMALFTIKDSVGQIVGMAASGRDVTAHRQAEQSLSDQESRLASVLNTAADGIITINQYGVIESVNLAAERMFGYAAHEMIGQNVKMLMPQHYAGAHDGYIANYLHTGVKKIIGIGREVTAQHKDGSLIPVELAVSEVEPLKLFTGVLRDVSERKRLQREIVEVAILEQQRLGADLHDECGQDLTALGLLASSLVQSLSDHDHAQREVARKIEDGLKRLLRYVHDVAHGLSRTPVDPAELSTALAELTERLGRTAGASCTFDGDGDVRVHDSLVATHLCRIAQEACTNAMKHAKAKGVQVRLRDHRDVVTLQIRDDGVGISDEPTEGLGMKIMRNRASVIGAELTIEPGKPRGTVVTCTLPKERPRAP